MCYNREEFLIRKAVQDDLDQLKALADLEIETIGFTMLSVLQEGIGLGYMFVAEVSGRIVGFQQYYHRKRDRKTTLYRKVIAEPWRRKGIGSKLVNAVVDEARLLGREKLVLKCPEDNESNKFHQSYGFEIVGTEPGKRRRLNVYEYRLE
jgi:GNAT superfamily N-acetyltransferase